MKQRSESLFGVNLGGWLVLERWMTPSVFDGTDAANEWELTQTTDGAQKIRNHHQTFLSEDDWRWLAAHNIQLVRIPFGHWIFGDHPPYVEAIEQLDWAVAMAKKYQIKVLLDMHAAVGAQNNADHSGSGGPHTEKTWLSDRKAQQATIAVLVQIAQRYYDEPHIWGLQLINEPTQDPFGWRLVRYYRQAYRALKQVTRPGTRLVISDAFRPWLVAGALWRWGKLPSVLDCHVYFCFGPKKHQNYQQQLGRLAGWRVTLSFLRLFQPVMVGEWSAVLGYPIAAEQRIDLYDRQTRLFRSQAIAHTYWNYKTEAESPWNFRWFIESVHSPEKKP